MTQKLLYYLNFFLLCGCAVLIVAIIFLSMLHSEDIATPEQAAHTTALPPNSFCLSQAAYERIDNSCLALRFGLPTLHLPDLRSQLTYYGANGRPDASTDKTLLHFAILASKSHAAMAPGERRYIYYDKKQIPGKYVFSPNNAETSLWINASSQGNEATVVVTMINENGEVIQEPDQYAQFSLPEKEFARFSSGGNWEIGSFRVDGTLLARQRARWYGQDCFLEKHGGEEFINFIGGQRIDFGENEDSYSCYVKQGDCLVWRNEHWESIQKGETTTGYPLLHVKKLDERLIHFELWDVEGKNKVALNLMKSTEQWAPANIQQTFKFVGARTRTQCVCEIDQERMLLKPNDWLILTQEGWKKMTTAEEIDDYVNRKLVGPLFIFDGIVKKDERPILVGTVYNATRTEMHTVELAVQSNITIINKSNGERLRDDPNQNQPPPMASIHHHKR